MQAWCLHCAAQCFMQRDSLDLATMAVMLVPCKSYGCLAGHSCSLAAVLCAAVTEALLTRCHAACIPCRVAMIDSSTAYPCRISASLRNMQTHIKDSRNHQNSLLHR